MILKALCYAFLCFILCTSVLGQTTYSIKGTITDSLNNPIEFGNVIALSPIDSSVVKGTAFWDGTFVLNGLEAREVLVRITSPDYITYFSSHNFMESDTLVDMGAIVLMEAVQTMGEIDVVVRKPMFERDLDKLTVNVEGTILSEKGTVLELLRSAPNVIVRADGSVMVVGKGAAIIYLDGRRVNTLEILNSLQASDISKIEIVDNPSAKYDAAGNAVIEIHTKSGMMDGYDVQFGWRGMYRTEVQTAYWSSISYRKKWFSIFASAFQYMGTIHEDENYYREVYGSPFTTMENTVERETFNNFNSGYNINMDFRLDSVNTIFINYAGSRRKIQPYVLNTNVVYQDSILAGSLESVSEGTNLNWMHSPALGYRLKIDTLGSEFRVTGQYTNFAGNTLTDIFQTSNFGTSTQQHYNNFNYNKIHVLSAQADYVKKWKNKLTFSSGLKFTSVTNESAVDLQEEIGGVWYTDSSTYNEFNYNENIGAAYSEIRGNWGKFSYLAGLRFEATVMQGNSLTAGGSVIDRHYQSFFPNVQLSYRIIDDLIMGASYNYRITRPTFQDMDPFVIFVDSLTAFRGNPNLRPSYTHNAEWSLIYKEYASIKLGYQRAIDPMFLTVEKDDIANTFSAITKNIESSEMYTLAFVVPWENDWWTTFNAFGYYFNNFRYADNETIIASTKPTWYISLYNEFRIPKVFNIELNWEYYNPGTQGFFIARPYQFAMASISRSFLDNHLKVNLTLYDPLLLDVERAYSNLLNFYVDYWSWTDSRSIMLTLRYNFGKLKNNGMVGRNIDAENKNRIKD